MNRRSSKFALLAVVLAGSTGVAACGNEEEVTHAESEASYFNVGELKYQVQMSRPLNPRNDEDAVYMEGLGPAAQVLDNDATFFGVFVRVQNTTDEAHRTASSFAIEDTQGAEYRPETLSNPFAYKPIELEGGDRATDPNDVEPAHYAPTQGKILVFKLPVAALDNRPLELVVTDPEQPSEKSTVTLDV